MSEVMKPDPIAWVYQNANTKHQYLVWHKQEGGRNWTPLFTLQDVQDAILAEREACAELVWPMQQVKVWSDKELTDMTVAFNRTQEKHGYGWYETIMAVGATALKDRAAAIRERT